MRPSPQMGAIFRDTYRYRELIWALALKELRVRYKRSVLGFLWALLNPALLMLVLTLVFGTIMRFSAPHYSIFLLSMIPLALLILVTRFPFHWTWLYLPLPMMGLFLFTLGAAFFFAAVNVYYRDVSHIIQVLLSAWFYFSPVIYSVDFMPATYQWLFHLNPMLYVLNGFRLGIYYGQLPSLQSTAMCLLCGVLSVVIGFTVFRRY